MQYKSCNKCGLEKSFGSFYNGKGTCILCIKKYKKRLYIHNRKKYLRYSRTYKFKNKEKIKEYNKVHNKKYYEDNKTELLKKNRIYRQKNKEKIYEKYKIWRNKNRKNVNEYARKMVAKIKTEVFNAYSKNNPVCVCCGEKDIRFLSLDHINRNGGEERKRVGATGYNFYYYLKKNKFPQNGYQILCYNCNFGKRFYKDCPHKEVI